MSFLLLASLLSVHSYQIPDPNCLRTNPGVLDAGFVLYNRFECNWCITKEDLAKHFALFSTRFKRAHEFTYLQDGYAKLIEDAIPVYKRIWKKNPELFVVGRMPKIQDNENEIIRAYKKDYEAISKINSENESPVVGLYLSVVGNCREKLYVINSVFGSKENSTLRIGFTHNDCLTLFQLQSVVGCMHRINFLTCFVFPTKQPSPEESADEVLELCSKIRDTAISANFTLEIMCLVAFPSYSTTMSGVVGSLSNFQRFWCRVVSELIRSRARDETYPQIIMWSAFDDAPADYTKVEVNFHDDKYHTGWWRRRDISSFEASAFVEKVEELNGGREYGNCSAECGICSSSKMCCTQGVCKLDTSFQPFEYGNSSFACQSDVSRCAPRIPKETISNLNWTKSPILYRPTSTTDHPSLVSSFSRERSKITSKASDFPAQGNIERSDVIIVTVFIFWLYMSTYHYSAVN